MVVVRENFLHIEIFHRQHRNAVGQTVTFIKPFFVKIERVEKSFG